VRFVTRPVEPKTESRIKNSRRVAFNAAISRAVPWPLLDATILLTQEPITPIPPAQEADQLKLALGEELFRVEHEGLAVCANGVSRTIARNRNTAAPLVLQTHGESKAP
jgi:hypothetical protein